MPSLCSHCQHGKGKNYRCHHPAWKECEIYLKYNRCKYFEPKQLLEELKATAK